MEWKKLVKQTIVGLMEEAMDDLQVDVRYNTHWKKCKTSDSLYMGIYPEGHQPVYITYYWEWKGDLKEGDIVDLTLEASITDKGNFAGIARHLEGVALFKRGE